MKITHKPINFEDARGAIRDIFPTGAPDCVTVITSAPGAIRGNHLHRLSTQYTYVVSGRMWAYTRGPDGRVEREALEPGDLLEHPPCEAHAFEVSSYTGESTVFLAFADGLRKGSDYEQDTERVPSLVDAWRAQQVTS